MAKEWTDEERMAFGLKMKQARASKLNNQEKKVGEPTKDGVTLTQEQFDALMARLAAVEGSKTESLPGNHSEPQLNHQGRMAGVMQKYAVDARDYDDPRPELMDTQELERFAFKQNYYLMWDVEAIQYENKWGIAYSEPRFVLKLYKRLFEEDGTPTPVTDNAGVAQLDENGKPLHKSYLVQRAYFFEDPAASIIEARALGITVTDANSKAFLQQMRKLRYKTWLLEIFQPKRATNTSRSTKTMMVGSTQVQVESYSEVV